MTSDYERIRSAILYIAENAEQQPTLEQVAAHVGLSPSHLQRLFVKWAGVSPKRFLQHLTAQRARQLLHESRPVVDTAFEVGLSGPGRLHDLMVSAEGATPGELARRGAGLVVTYGFGVTPFGDALVATTPRGICALQFVDAGDPAEALASLRRDWGNAELRRDDVAAQVQLDEVFSGSGLPGGAPLHVAGTNFQLKVWEALLRIPEGCVVSYSDLAERLGMPSASRAVANAVGANRVAYVIPCHRVLRSTGELGGYRWGTDRKLVMLERETVER